MVRALLRSYQGAPKETVAYFRNSIAERKYNNEAAAQYGLVASLLRNEEFREADVELAKLEKIAPPHPMVEAMAGHVLMESGKLDQAIDRFKSALARYPNKMQLIYDYPQALVKAGRLREAAAFLETELARYPTMARCIASPPALTPTSARSSRSIATRASSTPGRAITRRPSASSSLRRRRTTATSINRPSSRRGCVRCARN
jgi:tetratricopeptide (TPR) repeat protein